MGNNMERRTFLGYTAAAGAALMLHPFNAIVGSAPRSRLVMVGTGHRGSGFWGVNLVKSFSKVVEFVGLCDHNPGRMETVKKMMGVNCPLFTDFEKMIRETKPDYVIVTTVDSTHDEFIVKALDMGIDVITEKPMTTDEVKCNRILDAEKRSGKKSDRGF